MYNYNRLLNLKAHRIALKNICSIEAFKVRVFFTFGGNLTPPSSQKVQIFDFLGHFLFLWLPLVHGVESWTKIHWITRASEHYQPDQQFLSPRGRVHPPHNTQAGPSLYQVLPHLHQHAHPHPHTLPHSHHPQHCHLQEGLSIVICMKRSVGE